MARLAAAGLFYMSLEEINKEIYKRYPKKRKEDTCLTFADRMNGLRQAYRKRLMNEHGNCNNKKT